MIKKRIGAIAVLWIGMAILWSGIEIRDAIGDNTAACIEQRDLR